MQEHGAKMYDRKQDMVCMQVRIFGEKLVIHFLRRLRARARREAASHHWGVCEAEVL